MDRGVSGVCCRNLACKRDQQLGRQPAIHSAPLAKIGISRPVREWSGNGAGCARCGSQDLDAHTNGTDQPKNEQLRASLIRSQELSGSAREIHAARRCAVILYGQYLTRTAIRWLKCGRPPRCTIKMASLIDTERLGVSNHRPPSGRGQRDAWFSLGVRGPRGRFQNSLAHLLLVTTA